MSLSAPQGGVVGSEGTESGSPGVVELAVELPPFDGAVSGTELSDDLVVVEGCDEEADPDVVVDVTEFGDIDGCAGSAPHPTATTRPSDTTTNLSDLDTL